MNLSDLVAIAKNEKAFVNFLSSWDDDQTVSGYVPVRSTEEVFAFLRQAVATSAPQGRAVICHGAYGSGKSRLCSVLARLLRHGPASSALQPIWSRLQSRESRQEVEDLKQAFNPGGSGFRPWLVVPIYGHGYAGSLTGALIAALVKVLEREKLDKRMLGKTLYSEAARRLEEMVKQGARYVPAEGSQFASVEQLSRALLEDYDERALAEFSEFFRRSTFGVDFIHALQSEGGTALEAHDVYLEVARNVAAAGYDGIAVIWDEFGLALEALVADAAKGLRRLDREADSLQRFVERACSSTDLTRILFMGFAHVSMSEYGTRGNLPRGEQARLDTVSGRFRQPSIVVRLSVTETEGFHLLSGMIQRTPVGEGLFSNPAPRLQRLAEKMPSLLAWQRYSATACYSDIVAPCYPLHPATSTALILLSDQIAQVNRTTFYYLQDDTSGGLAGLLKARTIRSADEVGSQELARVCDLEPFFQEAISAKKSALFEQFQSSVGGCPELTDLQRSILQTILVLSVIADPALAPTTSMLCFCLADVLRGDAQAQPVLQALEDLDKAGAIYRNAATDVWRFVRGVGASSEIERAVEGERAMVSEEHDAAQLLLEHDDVLRELFDYAGDLDLDPSAAGVVRRIGIRILDAKKDERVLEKVNPALEEEGSDWRAALIYLVVAENSADVETWRTRIAALHEANQYFILPPPERKIDRRKLREFIAVRKLLENTASDSDAFEAIEGRYGGLRKELREQFDVAYGNSALRGQTKVLRSLRSEGPVAAESWRRLFAIIGEDLDRGYASQIRVRCGTFNEWVAPRGSAWSKIEDIVKRILEFDEKLDIRTEYLGFSDAKQQAAIVDGVLVENGFLRHDGSDYTLVSADDGPQSGLLFEAYKHFTTAGERDFWRLYRRLVAEPYGVPNGVIPIVVAVAIRGEASRIGIYAQQRRIEPLAEALVAMSQNPMTYTSRFTKLGGVQRTVFKAVGPALGLPFVEKQGVGEAFYNYCEAVRGKLKDFADVLPEAILKATELTEAEHNLLRLLRGPVPPQLPPLADALLTAIRQDTTASEELTCDPLPRSFASVEAKWREISARSERYVEGLRATVRATIREFAPVQTDLGASKVEVASLFKAVAENLGGDGKELREAATRIEGAQAPDVVNAVVSAVTGTTPERLTEEDFAQTAGMMKVLAKLGKQRVRQQQAELVLISLPNGKSIELAPHLKAAAEAAVSAGLENLMRDTGLSSQELAYTVICRLLLESTDPGASAAPDTGQSPKVSPA